MRLKAIWVAVLFCAGCASETPQEHWGESTSERRQLLDRIASACNLPPNVFVQLGDNDLRFRPSPDSRYEDVDCALQKLRQAGVPLGAIGFVGNERYDPGLANAQAH